MDNRELHTKASRLIRVRRAIKNLKALDTHLSDQIRAELESRGQKQIYTPGGDVTLYESVVTFIDPQKLFDKMGEQSLQAMTVSRKKLSDLPSGKMAIAELAEPVGVQQKLLTKPAKQPVTIKIHMSGKQPAA